MTKTYFISKSANLAYKNKLDEMLHKTFNVFIHQLIHEKNIKIFENTFNEVIEQYKLTKGRCEIPKYSVYKNSYSGNYIIHITDSCIFTLIEVKGELN